MFVSILLLRGLCALTGDSLPRTNVNTKFFVTSVTKWRDQELATVAHGILRKSPFLEKKTKNKRQLPCHSRGNLVISRTMGCSPTKADQKGDHHDKHDDVYLMAVQLLEEFTSKLVISSDSAEGGVIS